MATCGGVLGVLLVGLSASLAGAGDQPKPESISPTDKVIRLFNGKDLTGLYTWLKASGRQDPQKAFTVEDGVIHVSGEGMGYLATEKSYKNYHLIVEFIPRDDPNARMLLDRRIDLLDDYTESRFAEAFARYFAVLTKTLVRGSKRSVYLMEAK